MATPNDNTKSTNDIIFAKTRHEYTSYTDYWRLVDLSGFSTCFVDEIPREGVKDNVYIVSPLNGEWKAGIQTDARVIWYDLEWRLDGHPDIPGVSEVWIGDKWHAEQRKARYVPLGSHPGLREEADSVSSEHYDVAYVGYIIGVHRREHIRQQLIERGVNVSPPVAWGLERHRVLSNSTAYLCIHQHDNVPTIAPLRMVVAAAYGLPVITEEVFAPGIFDGYILDSRYNDLTDLVDSWCRIGAIPYEDWFEETGQELHQLLCEDMPFRKSMEAAV